MQKNAIYLQKEQYKQIAHDEYKKYFDCNIPVRNINTPFAHPR